MSRIHAGGGHGSRAATPVRPLPGMAPPWIALPAFLCLLFLVVPFAGIKVIDMAVTALGLA